MERGPRRRADAGEVGGVAAVIAANDDHQVDRVFAQQRDNGVLTILSGAADRVEGLVSLGQFRFAIAVGHRRANHVANLQRLGHQHRRLIGEADALQITLGIEPG